MATDTKVQFFSHLNGLVIDNNWGDLIALLDICLVSGLSLPDVATASIDVQGDINLSFNTDHKCLLLQIIELSGFLPANINGRYRIKGMPTETSLILKAELLGANVTGNGSAKLAALGYDKIYEEGALKRAYRAKNATPQHPYIRFDETHTDGANIYSSTYAKFAMVGLVENMTHINDIEDTSKLQLPLDTNDFKKNWKIAGTGTTVVRGWSRWHYATKSSANMSDTEVATNGPRSFTVVGDGDAFYMHTAIKPTSKGQKHLRGCGLFNNSQPNDIVPNWFLMTYTPDTPTNANANYVTYINGYPGITPISTHPINSVFFVNKYTPLNRIANHTKGIPIVPDYATGASSLYTNTNLPALEVPFSDTEKTLRGSLKHVHYAGNNNSSLTQTTPMVSEGSMYLWDSTVYSNDSIGGVYYYLGELE